LHHPSSRRTPRRARKSLVPLWISPLIALAAACGGGGGDDAGGHDVWRFAIEETAGSVQDTYARELERRVEERTGGAVDVKVYPYGTLGTSDDLTEQLRMGSLQLAMASPGHLGKTIPELQVFLLHFVLTDDEAVNLAAVTDPEFRREIEPLFPEKGLELLAVLPEGWMVWTAQKPIRAPADFEGVKIRTMTSPILLAAYEAYGASPVAMPYGEVYSALQLNMIDAQVNPIFAIEEMSFYEVTSHLIFARPAPFLTTLLTNPDFLAGMSPERRKVLAEVVAELDPFATELQQRTNAERLERILERKPDLVTIELDEAERDAFRELARPVREVYLEQAGERGERVLDALAAAVERAREAASGG
jgi:tripartite ATP-independent transporter DctP family solute receptor